MVELLEIIKLALKALRANKLRALLTMLGVIIGVTSVILLVSIGNGLQTYLDTQFESLGSNIVIIMPGTVGDGNGGANFSGGAPNFQASKLKLNHVRDLEKLGPPLVATAPIFETAGRVSFEKNSKSTTLLATTEQYQNVRKINIDKGRWLTKVDLDGAKRVAVIGPSLSEKLFGSGNPIGRQVTLSQRRFEVIGVSEKYGSMLGIDVDNAIYIPITTAQKVIGFDNLMEIMIKVDNKDNITEAQDIIKSYFLRKLTKDDFSVIDQRQILNTINQILGVLTIALGGIAAISLLVGGIGIMNIMLVSVTERTKEIGLRKAVGAAPNDILSQFLTEAVILSLGGGLLGILIGGGGSWLLGRFFSTTITLWSVLLSFGVSATVGIVFGITPAIRASRLTPVDALRYE